MMIRFEWGASGRLTPTTCVSNHLEVYGIEGIAILKLHPTRGVRGTFSSRGCLRNELGLLAIGNRRRAVIFMELIIMI